MQIQPVVRAPAASAIAGRQRAEKAAQQLEQVFVQYMVQGLRKSSPGGEEGGLFGSGPGAGTYEDWFDSHLSRHLNDRGGIGIARVILQDWERGGLIPAAEAKGGIDVTA